MWREIYVRSFGFSTVDVVFDVFAAAVSISEGTRVIVV